MALPIVRIEDWSCNPPVTMRYICGKNDIDYQTVNPHIGSLLSLPKCPHRLAEDSWPCESCESAFFERYWSSAAYLLDYFADFLSTDLPHMQSVWFQLLDIWQESVAFLPTEAAIESRDKGRAAALAKKSAVQFLEYYEETLTLFDTVIYGVKKNRAGQLQEPIIHNPFGVAKSPIDDYDTGPWISGLKPWQQFLCAGSPGVAAPTAGEQDDERVRYVPMAAIGIVKKHTERARRLAESLAAQDPDTADETLDAFDQHSLQFPTAPHSHTYTSRLTGQAITYHLANGAPPISRYLGLGDPDMKATNPCLTLLDECVGQCRGETVYVPESGSQDGGQGEEEEEEEEEEEAFDMWTVHESGLVNEGGQEGFGEMFEDWIGVVSRSFEARREWRD